MRLIFAGTPEFAERALAALVGAGHDIALVLTQPDRPTGRGLRPIPSATKRLALGHGVEVFQPATLKHPADQARVRQAQADALVVAAYGLILPEALLLATRYGAINIHASLLPRWRGAAPIQRALLAGDSETGVSIMQMDAGLDTGPILAQRAVPILPQDDAAILHDKLAGLGAEMIVAVLRDLEAGHVRAVPQEQIGATYARKVDKAETLLDWTRPAAELERAVRAYHPAASALDGEPVRIWRARVVGGQGTPGSVIDLRNLTVACGEGALAITEIQRAGGRRLGADDFLRGRPIPPGARFG